MGMQLQLNKVLTTRFTFALIGFLAVAPNAAIALEEIMVSATRRGETDLLSTPVAVTALTTEDVERYPVRDLNDIALSVPGLSSGNVSAFKSAQFALRGVSETTIIVYKESPIGVTLDEFVVPHIQTANLEMFDIESVEVLRGPQGTLFGKNTTGGVINVRTKRPRLDERTIEAAASYGDFDTKKINTALNLPLIDNTLAFRFAGMYLESDGYYENNASFGPLGLGAAPVDPAFTGISGRGDGRDLGGDDVISARAKLLWEPSDNFNALLQYEIIRDEGDTPPLVNESPSNYLFPVWGYPAAQGDPLKSAGVFFRDELAPGDPQFIANLPIKNSEGHRIDVDGFYLNIQWDINDKLSLFTNTGYREQESRLPNTYTGHVGPVSLFDATRDDDRETTQLEARLTTNFDGPLNLVGGLFFQEDDTEFCVVQLVGFVDNFFTGTPSEFFNNTPVFLCNSQEAEAAAIFVDGTYDITDSFHLTTGLRFTKEEKKWAGRPRLPLAGITGAPTIDQLGEPLDLADFGRFPSGVVRDEEDWTEPTYRLNLSYDFNDDLFGYVSYARGFKSGGYNDQVGTQLNPITPRAARPTEPEIADSWETGIRATLLGGEAQVGVTAYFVEYEDAQRTLNATFPTGQETLFFNAADLEVKGIEAEGAWSATDWLTFAGNFAWTDAEFKRFEADTDFDGMIDQDLSGNPVQRVPEFMATLNATISHEMPNWGGLLDWNLRVAYEDDSVATYSAVGREFDTTLNSKTLWDASITYTSPEERFYAKLFGKNLTDERYRVGSLSVGNFWVMSAYGPPRWFGLELGTKFGF